MRDQREVLLERLRVLLEQIDEKNYSTVRVILESIKFKITLNEVSKSHADVKKQDRRKLHPVRPNRGEIFNVLLSDDNVGKELNGNHPCVIISNQKKNIYSEKVNVVPIEGDGRSIDKMNHVKLTNKDLESGRLSKDPSRIIGGDIMTIDKSRLDRKIGTLEKEKLKELMVMVKKQLGM